MADIVEFSELQLSERIGSGAAGEVRRACWRGEEIAVKLFDYFNEFAEREITHLARLKHENIVKVYGTSRAGNGTYLLMEYVEGGSLHDFLHGNDQRKYSVEEAINWARQCAKGLAYMHSMEPKALVHRDIKPRNMLLTNMFKDLKICDFGTATDLATYLSNMRGTPAYMAPKVGLSRKADVYSFGIMLWEIMARKLPFSHLPNPLNGFAVLGAAERGIRPPIDDVRPDCWKGIKHLIQRCWDKDPALRPSMQKVEKYLGMLGASVNYKDFVHVLDDVTVQTEHITSGWLNFIHNRFEPDV